MPNKKLNVLLAITDTLRTKYKNMVNDMTKFFDKSQGAFLGERNTYIAKEGMDDVPSKRKYVKVVTTVDEKLLYYKKESAEFVDALMSQEKTNSSGVAKVELIVDGNSWGIFTSLELLRLKDLLESGNLGSIEQLLSNIPVRPDSEIWEVSTQEEYQGRNIWQGKLNSGVSKTTEKEEYILPDPNIATLSKLPNSSYTPKTSFKTKVVEVGDYTMQSFTGAWSHRERAYALKRRNDLLVAVIAALKVANDCESIKSTLTAEKIFGFIFGI